MSVGLYSHTTRATGTILTAAIYNSDHQNHITNQNPLMTGAYSDNLSEHQENVDPGGLGSEILAANLAEEITQLRFCIKRITGKAQWYIAPATDLESVGGTITDLTVAETVNLQGDLTPAQITANQNNYAPTNHADALRFRLSSDASRDITGLAGGVNGRVVALTNVGTVNNIVLKNEDAASTAANRFLLAGDVTLLPNRSIILQYDNTSSRWRPMGVALLTNMVLAGALTLNGNLGTVINLTQTGYTDKAALASPASPSAGNLRHFTKDIGGGTLRPAYKNSAGVETVITSGGVRAFASLSTSTSISSTTPVDDTVPQNTEGTEILSAVLPALSSASNRVRITFSCNWRSTPISSVSVLEAQMVFALFKDSDANALFAVADSIRISLSDDVLRNTHFTFEFAPGSAASSTYRIRAGVDPDFTSDKSYTLNSMLGAANITSMVVEEVIV